MYKQRTPSVGELFPELAFEDMLFTQLREAAEKKAGREITEEEFERVVKYFCPDGTVNMIVHGDKVTFLSGSKPLYVHFLDWVKRKLSGVFRFLVYGSAKS